MLALGRPPPAGPSGHASSRPAAGERYAYPQAETLQQLGDRLRPRLERVAPDQFSELVGAGLERAAQRGEFAEVPFEASRRDDLEDPARDITGVPERVPLVARLEDELTRPSLDDFVAQERAHASLEYEAVFVLARVTV